MKQLTKYIICGVVALFLFSCGNRKKDAMLQPDTLAAVDTIPDMLGDTLQQEESEELIPQADEYFDEFIYHFASENKFQLERIVFPLPYYNRDTPLKIEKHEWEHDSLFFGQAYYTLLLDNEDELELLSNNVRPASIQAEWIYLDTRLVKRYYFECVDGKWMLEAINLRSLEQEGGMDFFDFFVQFATDSVFQSEHIRDPLKFVTFDPDDDFTILETTLDRNQWFAFKPELPGEKLSNINHGQKNTDNSPAKILQLKGVGDGFLNTLFFRKRQGRWELYKFEDISN